MGALRREKGIDYTVNMSPIIDNGKIVGGISIVSNIEDVRKLSDTIHKYENEILRLENRIQAINRAKYTFDDIIAKDRVSLKLKADAMRIAKMILRYSLWEKAAPEKNFMPRPSTMSQGEGTTLSLQ